MEKARDKVVKKENAAALVIGGAIVAGLLYALYKAKQERESKKQ